MNIDLVDFHTKAHAEHKEGGNGLLRPIMKSSNSSSEFLRRISRRRRSAPNRAESIAEYIEQCAALLTPEDLEELQAELTPLNVRFAAITAPKFPHLPQQVKLLVDFLGDTAAGGFSAGCDASRRETAFALRYTAKETDFIPDFLSEIGYADDSLIIRTVLRRHKDLFRDYCRFREIRWITLAP
jgi:Protein of unknown function (DUF1232)